MVLLTSADVDNLEISKASKEDLKGDPKSYVYYFRFHIDLCNPNFFYHFKFIAFVEII